MTSSEKRTFRMHPDLLYSVIKNQAGSIGKAILELVMNSIDAGATRVEIHLDRKTVKVVDDGKGFVSRQEIDDFFECFGTPHAEGAATYGKFRMGRGQIMAFCRNTWRSGEFAMDVDIQGRGLDYTLRCQQAAVQGCVIEGVMYQPLNPSEVHATGNQLREQCLYTPIPIVLNGEQINRDVHAEKWTEITEDAFIRIESQSHRLSVFNLGVLVCHESAGLQGVGGVVVSRKALEVNFARNDVIKGKCEVWKRIRPILARYADRKDKRERRTEEWRDFKAQELLSWDGTRQKGRELSTAPVFTDLAGKHWSLESLAGNPVRQITLGRADSLKADRIHQSGVATVLDEEKMDRRLGARSFTFLLKRLGQAQEQTFTGLAWIAREVEKKVSSFEKLAEAVTDEHFVIPPKELTAAQKTTLAALNEVQGWLASAMSHCGESVTFHKRHVHAMRSETAEAYTDGSASIHIHEKYLSGSTYGPGRGMAWAFQVVNLLVHEYLHNFNSGVGHTHDPEFYRLFHEIILSGNVGDVVAALFRAYTNALKKIPGPLARQMDRTALIEDRLNPPTGEGDS